MPAIPSDQRAGETTAEMYYRHREAGTCFICLKPVVDGDARHGLSGAHYDCHMKVDAEFKAIEARVNASFDRSMAAIQRLKGRL